MNDKLQKIADMLSSAKDIAVFCHTNPDGDTIACALAMCRALNNAGKTAIPVCDSPVPEKYAFMEGAESFTLPDKRAHELAFAVDSSDLSRLGGAGKCFLSAKRRAAVDHHKSHENFAQFDYVEADASACAEIVFLLLDGMGLIDDGVAAMLFAGIVADSGCFQYPSTTARTHDIARRLMAYNIDAADIIYRVHRRLTPNVFALKNRVLSRCKFYDDGAIAVITFMRSDFEATSTSPADTEGMIASAIDVDGVEVAFAVSEVADKNFKVSVRTKERADASDIAYAFGGGGHSRAAGCRMNGFYEDVIDKLLKAARDRM